MKHHQAVRRRTGKNSEVYHNGVLLSQKKVSKDALRHSKATGKMIFRARFASPSFNVTALGPNTTFLPAGVLLKTPPSSPSLHSTTMSRQPVDLGIIQLHQTLANAYPSASFNEHSAISYSSTIPNLSKNEIQLQQFLPQWPHSASSLSSSLQPTLKRNVLVTNLPSSKVLTWPWSSSLSSRTAVDQSLDSLFLRKGICKRSSMNGMLSFGAGGEPAKNMSLDKSTLRQVRISEMLVRLLSNNLASYSVRMELAQWIEEERPIQLLRLIFQARDFTATAVTMRLLSVAIHHV